MKIGDTLKRYFVGNKASIFRLRRARGCRGFTRTRSGNADGFFLWGWRVSWRRPFAKVWAFDEDARRWVHASDLLDRSRHSHRADLSVTGNEDRMRQALVREIAAFVRAWNGDTRDGDTFLIADAIESGAFQLAAPSPSAPAAETSIIDGPSGPEFRPGYEPRVAQPDFERLGLDDPEGRN